MDRDALVRRNIQMAEAFHQAPMQHRLRRWLIRTVAAFPFAPLNKGWNRTLFIKPDHLGDMLLATPAMRALKAARPYSEIHVLASPSAASILAHYNEIDLVLTLPFPGFQRQEKKNSFYAPYLQILRVSRQLRQIGYGQAIIMRPDHWWGAMLAHVAGIRERVGYNLPDVQPFLTSNIPYQYQHVVKQNMRLVEEWTGPIEEADFQFSCPVFDQDRDYINAYLYDKGLTPQSRMICIHPGSGTWAKIWESEKWAQVADTLNEQLDAAIVLTGTDSERGLVADVIGRMERKAISTAGDMSIGQLAALYDRALAVLGPDSGPLHLAASVKTPTVSLYGPADPKEFGPWGSSDAHAVLYATIGCRPCRVLDWGDDDPSFHPCMREITVGQVLEAARRVVQVNQE